MKYIKTFEENNLGWGGNLCQAIRHLVEEISDEWYTRVHSSQLTKYADLVTLECESKTEKPLSFKFVSVYVQDDFHDKVLVVIFKYDVHSKDNFGMEVERLNSLGKYITYKIESLDFHELKDEYTNASEQFILVKDIDKLISSISKEDFEMFESSSKYNL